MNFAIISQFQILNKYSLFRIFRFFLIFLKLVSLYNLFIKLDNNIINKEKKMQKNAKNNN